MIDIDHFKSYNDDHGHEEGNVAIQAVAQTIRQTARQDDLAGRYGGEEFIVLMFLPPEDVVAAAERLRSQVESHCTPQQNPLLQRQLTISIGVGVATSKQRCLSPEELFNQLVKIADHELYRAKRTGRNRIKASLDV